MKDILAIRIDDKPGGLDDLLKIFSEKNININDSFAFVIESGKAAVLCVEVDNIEEVTELFKGTNFKLLSDKDLYKL